MESDRRELFVIVVAMLSFLVICVTAVVLFFRQLRRERGARHKQQERDQRF
jgi:integral membrane sensor domain MASE1